MHRKRVTTELHDSYFRLMKIKHAIPKIEWAIEWVIEWAIELLYNWVRTGSQTSWGSEKSETSCGKESHHSAEGASGPPMELGTRPVGDKM